MANNNKSIYAGENPKMYTTVQKPFFPARTYKTYFKKMTVKTFMML